MIHAGAALWGSAAQKLSGSTLTTQGEMYRAAEALRANRLEIQNRPERHVFGSVDGSTVFKRVLGARRVLTCRRDRFGLRSIQDRLDVKGFQDPDIAMNKVLLTASPVREGNQSLIAPTAALMGIDASPTGHFGRCFEGRRLRPRRCP